MRSTGDASDSFASAWCAFLKGRAALAGSPDATSRERDGKSRPRSTHPQAPWSSNRGLQSAEARQGCQVTKWQGRKPSGSGRLVLFPKGKGVGGVRGCDVQGARCVDLVEIYASVRPEVGQAWPDFYIGSEASISPGPGCRLFNKRTLTPGGGKKKSFAGFEPTNSA